MEDDSSEIFSGTFYNVDFGKAQYFARIASSPTCRCPIHFITISPHRTIRAIATSVEVAILLSLHIR